MNILVRLLVPIVIFLILALIIGFAGQYFAEQKDCPFCKLGSTGDCGLIGECNMNSTKLCWIPACKMLIVEGSDE